MRRHVRINNLLFVTLGPLLALLFSIWLEEAEVSSLTRYTELYSWKQEDCISLKCLKEPVPTLI